MDWRCAHPSSSFPRPDRALRELVIPENSWEAYSSSKNHRRASFFSSVALTSTAAAAAAETTVLSSNGNLATNVAHVSWLPAERGSAKGVRAANVTPPAWRHAGDAHSSSASPKTSWAASRCLVYPRLGYATSHGRGALCRRSPLTQTSVYP